MNVGLAVATLVLATNPPRRRAALSVDETTTVALGATLAAVALVVVAAVSGPLLDALDVSAPNARIAAGLVLAVVSLHDLVWKPPPSGAALPGRAAALVPVCFPVLLRPEVALVALSLGADHGVAAALLAATLGAAAVTGWHALGAARRERPVFTRVERGLGVVDAGLAAALAVALVADGVLAI
jgi:small neutral amino acid transporter SnatA (MarC family)